jgi:hypothetical protein
VDDADLRVVADDLAQARTMPASTSIGDDARTGLPQRQGEAAEPGADLADEVAGPDPGVAGDLADGVRIDDEVLPEALRRGEAVRVEEAAHVRGPQQGAGPPSSLTTRCGPATPRETGAMAANASRFRSMIRPSTNGPRSLIRTWTCLPFARFVTVTMVPRGIVRCAAVMPP